MWALGEIVLIILAAIGFVALIAGIVIFRMIVEDDAADLRTAEDDVWLRNHSGMFP